MRPPAATHSVVVDERGHGDKRHGRRSAELHVHRPHLASERPRASEHHERPLATSWKPNKALNGGGTRVEMDHSANFSAIFPRFREGRTSSSAAVRSVLLRGRPARARAARRGAAARREAHCSAFTIRLRSASRRSRARASAVAERAAARSASRDGLLPRRSACGVRRAALPALNFHLPWAASPSPLRRFLLPPRCAAVCACRLQGPRATRRAHRGRQPAPRARHP